MFMHGSLPIKYQAHAHKSLSRKVIKNITKTTIKYVLLRNYLHRLMFVQWPGTTLTKSIPQFLKREMDKLFILLYQSTIILSSFLFLRLL